MMIVRLKKPIEKHIASGHPWIYRDALEDVFAQSGEVITVMTATQPHRFVARGFLDSGPIGVRVWTLQDEPLAEGLLASRFARALELRKRVIGADTDAYRLLHGEGDRVPGLVCDVYGKYAVLQFDGQSLDRSRDLIVRELGPVLEKCGVANLLMKTGRGNDKQLQALRGEVPAKPIEVREHGMTLIADLGSGQKTGLFLDHRESRKRVRELASGLTVANLYGYTGGFSVAAGLGGATNVTTVDISPGAIDMAKATWAKNGLPEKNHNALVSDVPQYLDRAAREGTRFGFVVADPPSFAPNEAAVATALQSYRSLHATSMKLVTPGGYYLAASCSSHIGREAFDETISDAGRKTGRAVQVLERWSAPADHPRLVGFPEGDYLKVTLCRILD